MRLPTFPDLPQPDFSKLPHLSSATVAGISAAICGNVLISLALNCQKLAHRRLEREREQNGFDLERNGSKSVSNGEPRIDEEEETGDTPRLVPVSSPRHSSERTLRAAPIPTAETEPLLASHADEVASYDGLDSVPATKKTPKRPSLLARLSPWGRRAKKTAGDIDGAHIGAAHTLMPVDVVAAHTLMPVDVVTVRPISPVHESEEEEDQVKDSAGNGNANESDYLKSKLWWLGFLLMNVGEMGNFISYAFAPASVVAPLGTFALIANCAFAPLMLGEQFRKRDFFGIAIAILGAVTVVLSTNPSDARLDHEGLIRAITQRVFIVYSITYIVGAIILSGLSESEFGRRHVFVDVGLCALFGGFTVLSTKAFSTLLTEEWFQIFTEWITYPVLAVLLGTGIGQIRYLNRALMRFDSKIVVPTQFVTFNLSAIVGSAILYGDFQRASFHQMVTFLYGCAATFAGVFMIAWAPSVYHADSEDQHTGMGPEAIEGAAAASDIGSPRGLGLTVGGLSRRNRPTLILPEQALSRSATSSPILRHRQSIVSLVGFSPAQRVLLVGSPSQEFVRPLLQDFDVDLPAGSFRRRTVSHGWTGDASVPLSRSSRRGTSAFTSREASRTRDSDQSPRIYH